jgi:hypothetical protein
MSEFKQHTVRVGDGIEATDGRYSVREYFMTVEPPFTPGPELSTVVCGPQNSGADPLELGIGHVASYGVGPYEKTLLRLTVDIVGMGAVDGEYDTAASMVAGRLGDLINGRAEPGELAQRSITYSDIEML